MARGRFSDCLDAGIQIFRYKAMIHAKTCTIDGQWSTIGTANLDRLSAVGNLDLNAEIYSRALARQMDDLFEHDKTNATELLRENWSSRRWPDKPSERLLAPLPLFLWRAADAQYSGAHTFDVLVKSRWKNGMHSAA
jgi:cardiolipin synthase